MNAIFRTSATQGGRPSTGEMDPTSKVMLAHYGKHYTEGADALASLIANVMFLRNSMSRQIVRMCGLGKIQWITIQNGRVTEESKKDLDELFLLTGGKIFFTSVDPMKSRSKAPRRGWSELVSELVGFAKKARTLANLWQGDDAVINIAREIRKIAGFGGKGFRRVDG